MSAPIQRSRRTPSDAALERKALERFTEAARAGKPKQTDRLASRALDTFLQRPGTPEEVAALRSEASTLIKHDKSNGQIERRLKRELEAKPEVQAVNQVRGASQSLLGHTNTDPALLDQARALSQQGKSADEIRAATEATIKAGPEYRRMHMADSVDAAYQATLGRAPTQDEQLAGVKTTGELIDQGKSAAEVDAALADGLKGTPDFRKLHAADNVNAVYAFGLGRAPNADELQKGTALVGQLIDQGKTNDEVNGVLGFLMNMSPEFQARKDQQQRQGILDVAQGEVGTVEATNNNDGDVAKYPGFFGRGPESYCANFASYVLSHAGIPTDFFNTETMKNAFMDQGKWKGTSDPKPGDLVWFDWNRDGTTDHVGIVKGVNPDGTIRTIEGNTGGPGGQEGVWEQDRSMDLINGFANPA